jgi:hypothetical protein
LKPDKKPGLYLFSAIPKKWLFWTMTYWLVICLNFHRALVRVVLSRLQGLEINKYYADSVILGNVPLYISYDGCYVEAIFMVFQVIEQLGKKSQPTENQPI